MRSLTRNPVGRAVALAALAFVTSCTPSTPGSGSDSYADYNVVLISLDTLRADRLGVYGHERSPSPTLDRLARRSVVFEDVLAQCSTTAPSHRSLFTGHYVYEHQNDPNAFPVLPEILRDAGWQTAAFVDGGQLEDVFGFERGFDLYQQSGSIHTQGAFVGGGLRSLIPMATDWIREKRDDRFFPFLHTYDIHCPYNPPEPFREAYTGRTEFPFEIEGKCGQRYFNFLGLDDEGFGILDDLYDGGVHYTDHALAALRRTLEEENLLDRTIFIVTSDHGESLGERQHVGHNQVREVQLRVPLMFALPGGPAANVPAPVQVIDILPTVLSLLDLDFAGSLSGEDLSAAVTGTDLELPGERFRLAETGNIARKTVRRDRRWSLEITPNQTYLYDLVNDPNETRNLIFQEPEIVADLMAAFEAREIPTDEIIEMPTNMDEATRKQLDALGYN